MRYTVNELTKIAGISVRTLHYYDEIGLLKPSFIKSNGYRFYEEKEVLKLQQILFFRELEFSLEDITRMINAPDFQSETALSDQKKLLELKKNRIQKLINTIDHTIKTMKEGEAMNNDDLFASFGDEELTENMNEAKKRWGHTDAYKQSLQRTKHWTKEDYKKIKEDGKKFTQQLADAMDDDITSSKVQKLIAQHHKGIETFYDCSYKMYRSLGEMYVSDPRFTAYYDKFKPGLAKWLQQAMNYYCDQHDK